MCKNKLIFVRKENILDGADNKHIVGKQAPHDIFGLRYASLVVVVVGINRVSMQNTFV